MGSYFIYNLSLSEIAEEKNVSRAAVDDAIKKGSKKLEELHKKYLSSIDSLSEIVRTLSVAEALSTYSPLDNIAGMESLVDVPGPVM